MRYRPDIDGLRAIAVLSVVFYHAHLGFPGGYVGVDVFFVISGYLITAVLLKSIRAGAFSFADFWERRIRRLIPALAVVTIFTAFAGYFVLLPDDLVDLGKALIAQPLLLVNVYFWRAVQGGYFGDPPETRPMLHTWSLGVEEQFYVIFPILLVVIYRHKFLSRHIGKIIGLLGLLSLVLGVTLTPTKEVFSFFMLPTRAWELLLGASLSFVPSTLAGRAIRESCSWFGLALIGYSTFCFSAETDFPGWAALLPCVGSALTLFANSQGPLTTLGSVLSHSALTRIGQISYSLYLWHWPLMAYASYAGLLESTKVKWSLVLLSSWLGYISWRWIENPVRNRRFLVNGRAAITLFLLYAALCLGIGGLYIASVGFPGNWSPTALRFHAGRRERSRIYEADLEASSDRLPRLGGNHEDGGEINFLVWGDSHAMSVSPAFDALGHQHGLRGIQLTVSSWAPLVDWDYNIIAAKPPVSDEKKKRWAETALTLSDQHQLHTVFLVGCWRMYDTPQFTQNLELTLTEFAKRGVRVVLVRDTPTQNFEPPRALALATRWPWAIPELVTPEEHAAANASVQKAVDELSDRKDFFSLDLAPPLLSIRRLDHGGHSLYVDAGHLTDTGAMQLSPLLEPTFQAMEDELKAKKRGN